MMIGHERLDDGSNLKLVGRLEAGDPKGEVRNTSYITGFVDLARPDSSTFVLDRTGAAVDSWLSHQPDCWLAAIDQVALDPHRCYSNGLTTTLPHSTVVVDQFDVVGLANRAVDDVRRRVQQDTLGHRGRSGDPLYEIPRMLLRGYERLTGR